MADHGGGHHVEKGGGHEGGESSVEKLPVIGRAVKMLKTIVSSEGIKNFIETMSEYSVGAALASPLFIGELFGAKLSGGGGGHKGGHAPKH